MPSTTKSDKAQEWPSPPPRLPTAVTPGPRAVAFLQLCEAALGKTLKTVSYQNFAACFPTLATNASSSLQDLHHTFVAKLEQASKDDIATIMAERNVVENLNTLEDLLVEAKRRQSNSTDGTQAVVPHLLPASTILAAHLTPQLTQQHSQLNTKVQTTQSQNALIFQSIQAQTVELNLLVGDLENNVKDLENALDALAEGGDVRLETRDLNIELARM